MQGSIRNVPTKNSRVTFSIYDRVFKILKLRYLQLSPRLKCSFQIPSGVPWGLSARFANILHVLMGTRPDAGAVPPHPTEQIPALLLCLQHGHVATEQKHSRQPTKDAGESGLPSSKDHD